MANWDLFNQNLTGQLNSFLQRKTEERERQKQLNEMMQMAIMQAQVKQQFDPEAQFRQQILSLLTGRGQSNNQQPISIGGGMNMPDMPAANINNQANPQQGLRPRLKGINIGGMNLEFPQTQEEFGQELEKKGIEQKQAQEIKSQVPTVQQRNDLMNARNQLLNVQQMENLAKGIPSGFVGIGSIGLESITRGGMATNTRLYLKQFPAFAVGLYRGLTGDTRLSDADALRRALPLLWHPSESAKIKKQSFANIRKALQARIKLIQSGRYQSTPEGQFLTPLEDILSEAGIDSDSDSIINNEQSNRIGKYTFE